MVTRFLGNITSALITLLIFLLVIYQSWSSVILATIAILSVSSITQRESPGLPASANFQQFLVIFEIDCVRNLCFRKSLPVIGPFAATECGVQDKTKCEHEDDQRCKSYPLGLCQLGKALKIIRQWQ